MAASPHSAPDPGQSPGSPEDAFLHFRQKLREFFAHAPELRGKPTVVEDLLQDTYMRLSRWRPREVVRDIDAYVFRIAINVLRAWQRKKRLEKERYVSCEGVELELHAHALSSLWVQEDGGQALAEEEFERVLAQLPRACRVALVRQLRDDWSYEQIAAELGVTKNVVKAHIVRALNHFRVHYSMRSDR